MNHLTGKKLDAAYEYLNWYYAGWQGAFVRRLRLLQPGPVDGEEVHDPDRIRLLVSTASRRRSRSRTPTASPMEKAGAVRDGGSFIERVTNISCWNTLMDENRLHEQALERLQGRLTPAAAPIGGTGMPRRTGPSIRSPAAFPTPKAHE